MLVISSRSRHTIYWRDWSSDVCSSDLTLVLALGGSTNAVLHLMAIAREAGVEWTLADFDRLGAKVPHLADLKPGGRYVMHDLHAVGGTPAVLRALLDAGFLHGDCVTVTGKTLAENLRDV